MADEELLGRYVPFLQHDSPESFRSDSIAILPEHFVVRTVACSDESVRSKLLSSDPPAES